MNELIRLILLLGIVISGGCAEKYDPSKDEDLEVAKSTRNGKPVTRVYRGDFSVFREHQIAGEEETVRYYFVNGNMACAEFDSDSDGHYEMFVLFTHFDGSEMFNIEHPFEVFNRAKDGSITVADKKEKMEFFNHLQSEL